MPIIHASLWRGRFTDTYMDEVNRWLRKRSNLTQTQLTSDLVTINLLETRDREFDWITKGLADESALFQDQIVAILENPVDLKAIEIKRVRNHLESLDTPSIIVFLQPSLDGRILKDLDALLTEDVHDRPVPFGSPGEQIDWIMDWLETRDVGITRTDAKKIAMHSSESPEVQVDIVKNLATAFKGYDITWSDIEPTFSELGYADEWALSRAIVAGEAGQAVEAYHRNLGQAPARMVVGGLKKRYRMYGMVIDSMKSQQELADELEKNYYYMGHIISESRKLGKARFSRSYRAIARADQRITVEFHDENMVAEQLVAFLARQFMFARKTARR